MLRPRDWADAYSDTVQHVVGEWRLACRRHGIRYHRVTTDTPYGTVLREALAPGPPGRMIGFLHPWALLGLAAAGIPVLLHLLARREPPTVVFPAVRYLITTTQEHQRRLKLQNLLLLLVRTLLIVALVLAAAGPTLPLRGVPGHAPSALVLIVDNSPSSGAVVGGSPRLALLRDAARGVLARATPDDALWLITADGSAAARRRGDARRRSSTALDVSPHRLDLGAALTLARDVLAADSRPGEVVLLSDLQATRGLAGAARRPGAGGPSGRAAAAQRRHRAGETGRAAVVGRRRPGQRRAGRRLRARRAAHRAAGRAAAAPGAGARGRRGDARAARACRADGGR